MKRTLSPWLFREDYPAPPSAPGSATSQAAAAAVAPRAGTQRSEVLAAIRSAGARGYTRHEISGATGLSLQSVCARAKELLDAGLALVGPAVRPTPLGGSAEVLIAKESS